MSGQRCKSCRTPIIWASHAGSGRPAPIDATPSNGGNVILKTSPGPDATDKIIYTILSKEAAKTYPGGDAHLNHFATCPNAASHRPDAQS